MVQQPLVGRVSSLSRLHYRTQTRHTRWDSSGRVISPTHTIHMTIHNNQKRQTSMPPAGFEPAIPASERQETDALDAAATGIGFFHIYCAKVFVSTIGTLRQPIIILILFSCSYIRHTAFNLSLMFYFLPTHCRQTEHHVRYRHLDMSSTGLFS
jgi:hypothetical protein